MFEKSSLYKRRNEINSFIPGIKQPTVEQDEIVALLYAPDANGIPDCALGYALSDKQRPELQRYVENHLMRPVSTSPHGCEDPDIALEMICPVGLQLGRDRQLVGNYMLSTIRDSVSSNK